MPLSHRLQDSHIIKGNLSRVRERLLQIPIAEVGVTVITETELRFGVARKPEAARLKIAVEEFLLRVEVLPWDSEAAKTYALIRTAVARDGKPMGNLDMMIAAQALAEGVVLVTHDRVFRRVKGLKNVDWTQ